MAKRRTQDSADRFFDSEDNPIGLTGAFAPVKGPQSVDYDTDDDPVGLTQAFGAIPEQEEDERGWSEDEKWKGFDWDADFAAGDGEDALFDAPLPEGDADGDAQDGPADDGSTAPEPAEESEGAVPEEDPAPAASNAPAPAAAPAPRTSGRGRHAAPDPEMSPRMQRSRRTRRVLIVIVLLLVVLLGALGYFMFRMFNDSQQEAAQQAQEQAATPKDNLASGKADDTVETSAKLTDVPELGSLLGKTSDEAIAAIGRGALVTANREVDDDDSVIKTNLTVALTEEPADSKTGTPTVYLGLDEDGAIVQIGYSASASALGFGSLSFADAVEGEHVVEKTLAKIGVDVPEGEASLPEDKADYSTYASDGTTVVKERCSFEGDVDVNDVPCSWSAVLSYDYTTQVVTGNLNDTVRIIYAYVTAKD